MTPDKIIEALIFVSELPLKPAQVSEFFKGDEFEGMEMTEESAKEIMDALVAKHESTGLPWELRKIGGGYQFLTRKEFFPFLRSAVINKNQKKMSRAALETLSIIAYRQPVTRTEIEFIRGVNCDYAIQKLLERNLIEIAGRSDSPGKPLNYRTSPYFFEYFAINSIADLPKLEEIGVDEDEYQKQFRMFSEEEGELKKHYEESLAGQPPMVGDQELQNETYEYEKPATEARETGDEEEGFVTSRIGAGEEEE